MAQVNIRIDDNLKKEGEKLFNALGMNFSTAVSVFISQSLREGGLPFAVTTKTDPFYSEENQAELKRRIADAEAGINLTQHELIEV